MTPAGAVLAGMLVAVALIDFRTYRIPDWLSLPLVVIGLGWAAWSDPSSWQAHLLGAVGGYASLAAFGALYFRKFGRDGLGLGDAKLFAAAGAWLGWQALPMVLLIASAGGLIFALATGGRRRDQRIAFGPWICCGIWLVWLFAR